MDLYLETNKTNIAYNASYGDKPITVIFFGGFMSDKEGIKAKAFEKFANELNISFIRFDYFGHGKSSGKFKEGTIGHWKEDALHVIDELTSGDLIFVGSSMGGWISLLCAIERPTRVKGLLGIAAAPDFTENRIWDHLDDAHRKLIKEQGWLPMACEDPEMEPFPITYQLIQEAKNHLLLQNEIKINCPVRLVQGGLDREIPKTTPLKLIDLITSENVDYRFVETSDHRFSSKADLILLREKLEELINTI